MRKKRKLRARAASAEEIKADLALPEVAEALEAEALAAEAEAELGPAAEALEEEEHHGLSLARIKKLVESLLFASNRPLTVHNLRNLLGGIKKNPVQLALDELVVDYEGRGIVLHDVAGGYQFRTSPESSEFVQKLIAGRPVRLSRAQLETLAIVAYRQPITRPEIDEIRGVDSGGTLKILLDRTMVRVLGKKEEPGRPLLYGTTKDFLAFFNLNELRDLPTLREFHELSEDSLREVEALGGDESGVDAAELAAEVVQERDVLASEVPESAEAAESGEQAEAETAETIPPPESPDAPDEPAAQA